HSQFLRCQAIEQHARPLPDVRTDIDNGSHFCDVTRLEKRETAQFCVECDSIARKQLRWRKPAADFAQFSPILDKINDTPGENKFKKTLQADAPFLSSAKMSRPAAVWSALPTTTVRVFPTWARA